MRVAPSLISVLLLLAGLGRLPGEAHALGESDVIDLTAPPPANLQLVVSIQRFDLPENLEESTGLIPALSAKVGVAGTELSGVRVKIQVPENMEFERLEARVADGLFLERDGSFLRSVGRLLMGVARLLLFGRLVTATEEYEVSSHAWALLLGVGGSDDDVVSLQTTSRVEVKADDERSTHHGAFVVCRLVVAANSFSELVNVYVVGKDRRTGKPIRYHFPRLVLPGADPGQVIESDAWQMTETWVRPRDGGRS